MKFTLTRRSLAVTATSLALAGALPTRTQAQVAARPSSSGALSAQARDALTALEARKGGRLGVTAVEIGTGGTSLGRRIDYRANERFPMCSTHKFLTCAAIMTMVDRGQMNLERHVPYSRADLLEYAPITRKHVNAGFMTVNDLCAAVIEWSDNTADNLLLGLIGGPAGWTRYARSIGDRISRLDRIEPALNTAIPGDPRDTTTPNAMVRDLNVVLLGTALGNASRKSLENWMLATKITSTLLRAGLPQGWRVGDKSGSGQHGTRNDIGIILPPSGRPILACVYYTGSTEPLASRERVLAQVGHIIYRRFA
jgi:beta-lactamase class A